jgi:hypothetical protein
MQFLPPTVAAMVELQMLTGMRPGELCIKACLAIPYRPPEEYDFVVELTMRESTASQLLSPLPSVHCSRRAASRRRRSARMSAVRRVQLLHGKRGVLALGGLAFLSRRRK